MNRWKGRVALVTGASSGMGAGICRELVKYDMTVVGCSIDAKNIQAIAEEDEVKACPGRLVAIKCDLSKESEITAMFEKIRKSYGRIDVCINNAGIGRDSPLLTGKTEDWRKVFEINVLATCICTRESVKLMKENGIDDGQIIDICSTGGHELTHFSKSGWFGLHYYCGTKFMIRALAEGLRRELTSEKSHIRVALISPGTTETKMLSTMFPNDPDKPMDIFGGVEQPLRPKDIADTVVHILKSPPHVDINDIILRPVDSDI